MKSENTQCLVLNADFSPLSIISWKRAIVWSYKYHDKHPMSIEIIDFYKDDYIHGVNKNIPIPAVVRTQQYFRLNSHSVNFSRKNLFIRDNYSCQYCGDKKELKELTYDHVIPKSIWDTNKGSPTCWTNIVTACIGCNRKKGNKTPKQAKMPLQNLPVVPRKTPKYLPIASMLLKIRQDIPSEWSIYLPESYLA
jgi:5-methylcytosine-specific restriction endonuclease McrA